MVMLGIIGAAAAVSKGFEKHIKEVWRGCHSGNLKDSIVEIQIPF